MPFRIRERYQKDIPRGFYKSSVGSYTNTVFDEGLSAQNSLCFEKCADFTQMRPYTSDQPLDLRKVEVVPLVINGKLTQGSWKYHYQGWRGCFKKANSGDISLLNYPTSWDYWTTEALANLNPDRPSFDWALFLYELKDIVPLLAYLGRRQARADALAKAAKGQSSQDGGKYYQRGDGKWVDQHGNPAPPGAGLEDGSGNATPGAKYPGGATPHGAYVQYQFGWKPLYRDLKSILGYGDSLQRRLENLKDAMKGSRFERKLGGDTIKGSTQSTVTGFAYGRAYHDWVFQSEVWFTVNITPVTEIVVPDGSVLGEFRRILSLDYAPSTIWNMLPWSWLVDYFVNIGSYIKARENAMKFRYENLNLMQRQETMYHTTSVSGIPGALSWSGGEKLITAKLREIRPHPNPVFALHPIIPDTGTLILSAIGIGKLSK